MSAEYAKLAPKEESIEFGGAAPEESAEYTVNWETEKDDALARKYPFQRIVFLWPLPPCDACLLKYHHSLMPRHVLVDEPTEEGEQESLCAREQTGKVRRVLNAAGGYESLQEKDIHKWPLWSTTHDELAQIGGPGALVYFELLYQLRFVFFIMALLNTPSMFLNLYAPHNMYDSELLTRAYKTWTARTTLGSVYAEEETLDSQGGLFSGHAAGMWVRTVLDACSVAYFGYFAIKWKREGKKLNEQADGATKSMADYTVSVRPRRSWPAVFKRSDDNDGEKQKQFINDLKETMEKKYGVVANMGDNPDKPAIWLAFDERKVIQLSRTKCDQLLGLEEALAAACAADWQDEKLNETVASAAAAVKQTNVEMNLLRQEEVGAVEAFVTFDYHKDAEAAIEDSDNFGEFEGQNCTLRTPPEPESLHWESLPIQPVEQACRKYGILTATVMVLVVGFLGVIVADIWKGNTAYLGGCDDAMSPYVHDGERHRGLCVPFEYPRRPEDRVDGWQMDTSTVPRGERDEALDVYKNGFREALDSLGSVHLPKAVKHKEGAVTPFHYPDDFVCTIDAAQNMDGCCIEKGNEMTWKEAKQLGCHRIDLIVEEQCKGPDKHECDLDAPSNDTDAACPTGCTSEEHFAGDLLRYGDADALCYMCLCECSNILDSPAYLKDEPACFDIPERENYCQDYKKYRRSQKANKLLGVFIVVLVNFIIGKIILKTQPHMGLHTHSEDLWSIAFRTFLLQFFNTGLLVLLLRMDQHLPVLDAAPTEKYGNICAKWYATVGAPLIKTMVINFLASVVKHAGKAIAAARVKRCTKAKKVMTQNGLNQVYADSTDSWNMAGAYAELLLPMAVCMLYSSGIPVLLWIATAGFTYKYWVDKWCMLHLYEKPAQVSDSMMTDFGGAYGIMTCVLCLKITLGTWLYASAGGVDPRREIHGDVTRAYVIPYLLVGIAVVLQLCRVFISRNDDDDTASDEQLLLFHQAYKEPNYLVNTDNDYEMDEVEKEEKMEAAFRDAIIRSTKGTKPPPKEVCDNLIRSIWDGGLPDDETVAAFEENGIDVPT